MVSMIIPTKKKKRKNVEYFDNTKQLEPRKVGTWRGRDEGPCKKKKKLSMKPFAQTGGKYNLYKTFKFVLSSFVVLPRDISCFMLLTT